MPWSVIDMRKYSYQIDHFKRLKNNIIAWFQSNFKRYTCIACTDKGLFLKY